MIISILTILTSFLITYFTVPIIIKFSLDRNWVDIPGRRKIHDKATPSMGGIAIFLGFIVTSLIWTDFKRLDIRYVLACLFITFVIGVRDDIAPFRAQQKLLGQIVAVIILLLSPIRIQSFYGFLGIHTLPIAVGYILSGFSVIIITNAFNLIDGLDGLAGSIGLLCFLFFGIWFYIIDDYVYFLFSLAMVGGLFAFLIFNWQPSKIFMGDTGALITGMLLAICAIRFMTLNDALPKGHIAKFSASIATALCILIVPLCDTLRVIIQRLGRGQSPFKPDKTHIHHVIMRLGKTHAQTTLILVTISLIYILLAVLLRGVSDNYMIPGVIIFSIILCVFLNRLILKKISAVSRMTKDDPS